MKLMSTATRSGKTSQSERIDFMEFEEYIGTKRIQTVPMTRGEYNKYRGWTMPENENPDEEGYFIRYPDGCQSWSPKKQFEDAYRKSGHMNFGHALEVLKHGGSAARSGWNGKNQYIQLADCISYRTADSEIINAEHDAIGNKAIAFVGTSGVQLGWLASQADMLAEDWMIVS